MLKVRPVGAGRGVALCPLPALENRPAHLGLCILLCDMGTTAVATPQS